VTERRANRPRDPLQLAKLIGNIATPAAEFGWAVSLGFLNKAHEVRAVGQVAQIRECNWARE
jgi:hypothetical protein